MDVSRLTGLPSPFAEELAPLNTMEEVLRWAVSRNPPATVGDVIAQDDFTHDVTLGIGWFWLVFDITCQGGIRSVTGWRHRPTAEELLDARRRDGWVPAPGQAGGARVLGHAGCRFR
jgi:hypothetical protein